MNSPFTGLDFERFTYRQGQLLASRDFRDQQRMEEARRWMHNTALHNAWGVAIGYGFSLPGGRENADEGDRPGQIWEDGQKLTLQPGIAYDCFGRELILPEAVTFNKDELPDIPEEQCLLLVASYQDSERQPTGGIICRGSANSAAFPQPLLRWKPERQVHYEMEVPILFVTVATVVDEAGASVQRYSVERYANSQLHPQARPKIASGQTVPGLTAWRFWEIDILEVPLGLQVDIDTSDAGFQQTPCYFAWLNGSLFMEFDETLFALTPFISLANERPDGFTFRVILLPRQRNSPVQTGLIAPDQANRNNWTVCWLGIDAMAVELQPAQLALPAVTLRLGMLPGDVPPIV